ncbi:hypothetical protein [Clostridium beijerinckii]|uniref:hypothetical protein n=1 Tax=Clostridium beijerinckii TaxID=1520 RepID=UPI001F243783|nr:hypothetical protein [Clostridium beijerinckii]
MSKKSLQTSQEKLLYAASLLGFDESLELVEDRIKENCGSTQKSNTKIIEFRRA